MDTEKCDTLAAVMLEICAFRPDCLSGRVSAIGVDVDQTFTRHSREEDGLHALITYTGVRPACMVDIF
jgi:hypothetical protein